MDLPFCLFTVSFYMYFSPQRHILQTPVSIKKVAILKCTLLFHLYSWSLRRGSSPLHFLQVSASYAWSLRGLSSQGPLTRSFFTVIIWMNVGSLFLLGLFPGATYQMKSTGNMLASSLCYKYYYYCTCLDYVCSANQDKKTKSKVLK